MSQSCTITKTYSGPGGPLESTETITNGGETAIDDTITNGADRHFTVGWLNANLKSLFIFSDQALTIEWNDSTGTQGSISLQANKALEWQTGGYHANPFVAADVTDLYITNASGTTANFSLRVLVDMQP